MVILNHQPKIKVDNGQVRAKEVSNKVNEKVKEKILGVIEYDCRFKLSDLMPFFMGFEKYWKRTEMVPVEYYYRNAAIKVGLFVYNSLSVALATYSVLYAACKGLEKLVG